MIKVKVTIENGDFLVQSQLPSMEPVWENCVFFINQDIKECDFWIVWGSMSKKESVICPPENVIFIAGEPPTVYKYEKKFLDQFGTIITTDRNTGHKNPVYQQQSLPWWLGYNSTLQKNIPLENTTYSQLIKNNTIKKTKEISTVISNKQSTKGHKKRFEFTQKLKTYFKNKVDVFGIGFNQCTYKWDAIAPYKYHIAIENSSHDDYWTEKLADSILAEAYTFYYGCKNLNKYFSDDIYTEIDIEDFESSVKKIEEKMKENAYEKNIKKIIEAKHLILNEYQLFPNICSFCNSRGTGEKHLVKLRPESKLHRITNIIKNTCKKISKNS